MKQFQKWTLLFNIFSIMIFIGCTEVYEPDISVDKNYLIVEGLITDEPGPHKINLSRSNTFGEDFESKHVENAILKVVDSQDNVTHLEEKDGNYYTPANFSGQVGEIYTLHIATDDGSKYRSKSQEIVKPVTVDKVYAEFDSMLFFSEAMRSGNLYEREIDGINVFLDVHSEDGQSPQFRFTSVLMLQYAIELSFGGMEPIIDFCWDKVSATDYIEADVGKNLDIPESKRNHIAFVPLSSRDMRYIGLETTYKIIGNRQIWKPYANPRIIKSVYTLNDDAYTFHVDRNKQLSDEGHYFDPISPQLNSNIYNVDDPDENVLGFFEASSVTNATLYLNTVDSVNIEIDTLECMEHLPSSDCISDEMPDWWI